MAPPVATAARACAGWSTTTTSARPPWSAWPGRQEHAEIKASLARNPGWSSMREQPLPIQRRDQDLRPDPSPLHFLVDVSGGECGRCPDGVGEEGLVQRIGQAALERSMDVTERRDREPRSASSALPRPPLLAVSVIKVSDNGAGWGTVSPPGDRAGRGYGDSGCAQRRLACRRLSHFALPPSTRVGTPRETAPCGRGGGVRRIKLEVHIFPLRSAPRCKSPQGSC